MTTDADGRYELCRLPLPPADYGRTCVFALARDRFRSLDVEFRGDTVLNIDLPTNGNRSAVPTR